MALACLGGFDSQSDSQSLSACLRGWQEGIHLLCRFALQRGGDVRVEVHRRSNLGVPEKVSNHSRLHFLIKQQRCRRVPQVMTAPNRKTRSLQHPLEVARDVDTIERSSCSRSEHQTALLPVGSRQKTVLKLCLPVFSKRLDDVVCQSESATTLLRLWLYELRHPVHPPERLTNAQLFRVHIHIFPKPNASPCLSRCVRVSRYSGPRRVSSNAPSSFGISSTVNG